MRRQRRPPNNVPLALAFTAKVVGGVPKVTLLPTLHCASAQAAPPLMKIRTLSNATSPTLPVISATQSCLTLQFKNHQTSGVPLHAGTIEIALNAQHPDSRLPIVAKVDAAQETILVHGRNWQTKTEGDHSAHGRRSCVGSRWSNHDRS